MKLMSEASSRYGTLNIQQCSISYVSRATRSCHPMFSPVVHDSLCAHSIHQRYCFVFSAAFTTHNVASHIAMASLPCYLPHDGVDGSEPHRVFCAGYQPVSSVERHSQDLSDHITHNVKRITPEPCGVVVRFLRQHGTKASKIEPDTRANKHGTKPGLVGTYE